MAASRSCNGCSGRWAGSARWQGRTTISANTRRKKIPYAIERYVKETNRLYGVLDKRLADREFVAGEYSIADMASYPWVVPYERQGQKLDDFPNLKRWFGTIRERPAVVRAYELAKKINVQPTVSDESRSVLFGQTAAAGAR
jgi:GST-like protein